MRRLISTASSPAQRMRGFSRWHARDAFSRWHFGAPLRSADGIAALAETPLQQSFEAMRLAEASRNRGVLLDPTLWFVMPPVPDEPTAAAPLATPPPQRSQEHLCAPGVRQRLALLRLPTAWQRPAMEFDSVKKKRRKKMNKHKLKKRRKRDRNKKRMQ